jgi:hypothetical protein
MEETVPPGAETIRTGGRDRLLQDVFGVKTPAAASWREDGEIPSPLVSFINEGIPGPQENVGPAHPWLRARRLNRRRSRQKGESVGTPRRSPSWPSSPCRRRRGAAAAATELRLCTSPVRRRFMARRRWWQKGERLTKRSGVMEKEVGRGGGEARASAEANQGPRRRKRCAAEEEVCRDLASPQRLPHP